MRTPADLPRRLPRASRRTRIGLVIGVVVVIVLLTSLSGLARFWTDYLWFQSVGFTSVFRGVLLTKVVLALVFIAIFFVLLYVNLVIADRVAPDEPAAGVADELVVRYRELVTPRARIVRIITAALFALLAGISANREWNNWDLLRYHVSFGATDPEYHKDVGFYVFELPFIKFLLGWAFEALIVVLIVTLVAHYLNGGIHLQGSPRRVTSAVKTHVSVLLGVLALIKAVDYYFDRLQLVLSRSHVVDGATATSVHANKPALALLLAIAVIAALLFLINIRQKGWTLPAVAVGLWILVDILVGVAYPALYQSLRVNPSALTRETPYIQRNIDATNNAYGLNNVQIDKSYNYQPTVTAAELQGNSPQALANQQTLANVRLLDPAVSLLNTFDKYQALRTYYQFSGLNLDRYTMPDPTSPSDQTLVATINSVRELNTQVPAGFVNQHLEYTHGYGAVQAPISESGVNADGTPDFTLQNLPPSGTPSLTTPGAEIYYGEGSDTGGYVIADSKTSELDYGTASGEVTNRYSGKGGVPAGSLVRRAAFALTFGDANFILSGQITPSSRVIFNRNINTMVRKAAPFLKYDSDPYAVILNNNVYWVVDAYTTTDNYPYSQNASTNGVKASSGLNSTFNYVRNSVKVVINAFSGQMNFFVVDPSDPIIKVYERAFPDLFTTGDPDTTIPGIVAHFRYPEDIFTVQTDMFGRYHLTKASDFYTEAQAWTVSPDPGSGALSNIAPQTTTFVNNTPVTSLAQLPPQYVLAHLPDSTQQSFMLLEPFVPIGASAARQNLTAFMAGSSGPLTAQGYGALHIYESPPGATVDGPALVTNAIRSYPPISQELTLLNQGEGGSTVELGEVAVVPLDQTLLYVQPVYVESSANAVPTLKDVVVFYDHQAYQSNNASLDNALCQVVNPDGTNPFSAYCNTPAAHEVPLLTNVTGSGANNSGTGSTTTTTTPTAATPTTVPSAPAGTTVASLLAKANSEFAAANAALKAGNLGAYATDVNVGETYVAQAEKLAAKAPSG